MKYVTNILIIPLLWLAPQLTFAEDFVTCTGTDCSFCNLVDMGNTALVWLMGILFMVFAVMVFAAGWRLITSGGNTTAKEKSKSMFMNAFIGLVIILAAWVLVDTVMRVMLAAADGEIEGYGPWTEVKCLTQTPTQFVDNYKETAIDEVDGVGTVSGVSTPVGSAAAAGTGLTDAEARAIMEAAGIEAKAGVSYAGVKPHVLNELIALDAACNCDITVTAVTDGNHAGGTFSHGAGFKADLRTYDNPELVNYVKSLPYAGSWKDGTKTYYDASSCATYAVESDHVDVVYKTGC